MSPWTAAHQGPLTFTISWSLLRFMSTKSMMLFNHLISVTPFSSCPQSCPASVLQRSAFFTVQLSHPYMTTGKTTALTTQTFVGKVISLLFNMLSRFVWPWSTKWRRAKANSFAKEHAGHKKNTLFQQHKTCLCTRTSPDGQYRNKTLQPKMEKLCTVSKNKTRS